MTLKKCLQEQFNLSKLLFLWSKATWKSATVGGSRYASATSASTYLPDALPNPPSTDESWLVS